MPSLTSEERSFFSLVQEATAANPFGQARKQLDRKIAGRCDQIHKQHNIDDVVHEVGRRIEQLQQKGSCSIKRFSGRDRELVQSALLFHIFHRFAPQFDRLIAEQSEQPDADLAVPFAGQALHELKALGFSAQQACRYFELFFQMRRAFFFIGHNIVGCSACMIKLRERLWNNVFTHNLDMYDAYLWNRMEDFSTLILGPTGAGKGTAAAAIGCSGYIPFDAKTGRFRENFRRAFISLNLSQFSEALIESELFGHKKGAFTGAVENYQGVFDRCSPYGSILLDEIGEVGEAIQIKLLQVLQERTFVPVGDHRQRRFSGRVIAATNRPMAQIRQDHILRDDFFYRLCSDVIKVPSLAQRIRQDHRELEDLVHHTVSRIVGNPSPELADQLHRQIVDQLGHGYAWPGNVRELEQCVRRLLLNQSYAPFTPDKPQSLSAYLLQNLSDGTLDLQGLICGYCFELYRRFGTYEAVAQTTRLDRRTAKKHAEQGRKQFGYLSESSG